MICPLINPPPRSHHYKIRPVESPWSHCPSSPACTACRSPWSRTCMSGTAWCSSASQTGNRWPGRRHKHTLQEMGRNKMEKRPKTRKGLGECRCWPLLHRSCSRVREASRLPGRCCKPERAHAGPHRTHRHCCKQWWRRPWVSKNKQILLLAASPAHLFDNRIWKLHMILWRNASLLNHGRQ